MPILSPVYSGVAEEPQLVSAVAIAPNRVRLVFSEELTNNAALVLAANYVHTPAGGSAARTTTSVLREDGVTVVLTLDGDLTTGTNNYTVVVSNVTDLVGNVIDAANDDAVYSGPNNTIVLNASSEDTFQNDGGGEVILDLSGFTGTFRLFVGPAGDETDPSAFILPVGGGNVVELDGTDATIRVFLPILPAGGPYAFTLQDIDSLSTNASDPLITVVPHDFKSSVLSMRRLLPPKWDLGIRRLEDETYPQP